ncbi:MAG: DUF222 domain-containing protein [Acidimicrobiia bacterium]
MGWEEATNDQIDEGLDHFGGLAAAGLARVCELIRVVDQRQSWMSDGARSLVDWVAARLRVRHETAVQLVGAAKRLADLPVLSEMFASGGLSVDQVDAVSRMATPETEADLIEQTLGWSNAVLDRAVRRHRGITETEARSVWKRRRLIRQWNLDESELRFKGNLPAEAGKLFDEAIDTRIDRIPPDAETGMFDGYQTRAADALTELAATSGDHNTGPNRVNLFADLEALTTKDQGVAELDNGALIPNSTAQRLGCDPVIRTIIQHGHQVIGVGRASRQIPRWLRDLVYQRDGYQCQHPGCGHTRWLQVHHIVSWADGGPTDLDNLILLCGFHHRYLHEHRWHITGPPHQRVFRRPDQTPHPQPRPQLDQRLKQLVRTS